MAFMLTKAPLRTQTGELIASLTRSIFILTFVAMRTSGFFTLTILCLSGLWTSCDNAPSPGGEPDDTRFDRAAMLSDYATLLIVPALTRFQTEATDLLVAAETFTQSPDDANWDRLQGSWISTATAWQTAQAYNFGPADGNRGDLFQTVGAWPINVARLEGYVSAGDTSLANFDQTTPGQATRGLPGLEYLVFADNARDQLLNAPNRQAYLRAVARDVVAQASEVLSGWEDGYTNTFISNDGISAGSSTSLLYNQFLLSFERLKNFKVGVPAGLRAGQAQAEPSLVEAYYSRQSLPLLREHFDQMVAVWEGRGNVDGLGFREYLQAAQGGEDLITSTEAQLESCRQAFDALPAGKSLAQLIEEDIAAVTDLHTELQKLTRFFKSDMSSLLSIAITYDSGDGD
jgi:hypothetical protein